MANIMTKRGSLDNIVTYEHYCDTKADLANIPENEITLGSTAIVLQDEDGALGVYIATSDKEWIAMMTTGGSGGSGSDDSNSIIELIDRTISGEVVVPNGTTNIGKYAFSGCDNVTSVVIPESVTKIDDYAFYGNHGMKNISIAEGVTSIGNYAFQGCSELEEIRTPESCTIIDAENGGQNFASATSLKLAVFPNVTTIKEPHTEYGMSPETNIFDYAGYGVTGQLKIYFPKLTKVPHKMFGGGCSAHEIYIGADCTEIASDAFSYLLSVLNLGFAEGAVSGAPWGATKAVINYNVPMPEIENE